MTDHFTLHLAEQIEPGTAIGDTAAANPVEKGRSGVSLVAFLSMSFTAM
jgi:hypothetical protein